jgi:hypothetical protein
LVERAVRSLLAAGLERVLVVVGHDAGLVATVVGRLGRGRVKVVYADRWADGNGASLVAVVGDRTGALLELLSEFAVRGISQPAPGSASCFRSRGSPTSSGCAR